MESFFSKYDTCARKTDFPELDEVRTAQYSSLESRTTSAVLPRHPSRFARPVSERRAMRARQELEHTTGHRRHVTCGSDRQSGEAYMLTLEGKKRGRTHAPAAPADNWSIENFVEQ